MGLLRLRLRGMRTWPATGSCTRCTLIRNNWGRGVGVVLMKAARGRLFELGFVSANLWLLAGNARAGRFYEIDGWRQDGQRRTAEVWGVTVDEVRYLRGIDAA